MKGAGSRHVSSKLLKTKALLNNKRLIPHIPRTKRFNRKTLQRMLRRYRMVYLKPVHGLKGIGIMKAEKRGKKWELRHETKADLFKDVPALYRSIRRRIRKKAYLVQKGIRTLRYQGRPFDFRIMVQKNEQREWEVTGIVGRVAPPNRIVTNRSQGGTCMPARKVLRPSMKKSEIGPYVDHLYRLSRRIGRQFRKSYPNVWQLGVDIAVSRKLKPWILEVNTSPAVTPFLMLSNRSMYRRIARLVQWNRSRNAK
ncbi:YheC/YheD family protein [Cohnella sp. CFH 77786]|uniref:YheC/YheD family protein n=1 Tax=Cohnella sp. CFH 77786 TaxID=2662265 RepID=UPI001C60918E|nr:YheC/YheD family protein [Cohnella sp. CFH 77786]MBW5447705.1 YheC/YheD family protein [Cohnella sp. CFH 77786]